MWRVNPPSFSVAEVLAACTQNIANAERKAKFRETEASLFIAETDFQAAVETWNLHTLPPVDYVNLMGREDMIWLYDQKLVDIRSPGRTYYDSLKLAAPHGKCPLCGRGAVYSLDHHLPKTLYSDLTITPFNLLPACQDCNKNKADAVPTISAEETLHPYFDDVEGAIWLRANIVEVAPAALSFYADPPHNWPLVLRNRVRHHFRTFKLKRLYASEGASLLSNIKGYLGRNMSAQDACEIREYCRDQALSYRLHRQNSWQAASYTAMAESDWFCSGGYLSQ